MAAEPQLLSAFNDVFEKPGLATQPHVRVLGDVFLGAMEHGSGAWGLHIAELVPLEILEFHLWPLLENSEKAALKAASKGCSTLCNQLLEKLTLRDNRSFAHASLGSHAAAFICQLPRLQAVTIDSSNTSLDSWLDELLLRPPALERLARLRSLTVASKCDSSRHTTVSLHRLVRAVPTLEHASFALPALPYALGSLLAAHCPRLRSLCLTQTHPQLQTLERVLSDLQNLPCLRSLEVATDPHTISHLAAIGPPTWPGAPGKNCLEAVANLPSLRRLSWRAPWTWPELAPLARLQSLASLELAGVQALPADRAAPAMPSAEEVAASLGALPHLETLLMPCTELSWGLWHQLLAALPQVRSVSFWRCRLFAAPLPLPHVQRLALRWESSAEAVALAACGLPALRALQCETSTWLRQEDLPAHWAQLQQLDQQLQKCAPDDVDVRVALVIDQQLSAAVLRQTVTTTAQLARVGRSGVVLEVAPGAPGAVMEAVAEMAGRCFPNTGECKVAVGGSAWC